MVKEKIEVAIGAVKAAPGSAENTMVIRALETALFRHIQDVEKTLPEVNTAIGIKLVEIHRLLKSNPGSPENTLAIRAVEEAIFRHAQDQERSKK